MAWLTCKDVVCLAPLVKWGIPKSDPIPTLKFTDESEWNYFLLNGQKCSPNFSGSKHGNFENYCFSLYNNSIWMHLEAWIDLATHYLRQSVMGHERRRVPCLSLIFLHSSRFRTIQFIGRGQAWVFCLFCAGHTKLKISGSVCSPNISRVNSKSFAIRWFGIWILRAEIRVLISRIHRLST